MQRLDKTCSKQNAVCDNTVVCFFCRLTKLTQKEVLDMIDLNQIQDTNAKIVVEPPEVHYLTDEDSAEEDNADLNHLSGNQLRALAFIKSLSAEDNFTGNPLNEVLSVISSTVEKSRTSKRKKVTKNHGYKWKKEEKMKAFKSLFLSQISVITMNSLKLNFLSSFLMTN